MITLVYAPENTPLADRIRQDLESAGYTVTGRVQPGGEAILVAVLSPHADQVVQQTIVDALENRQHIIPVLAAPIDLPRLIDHLQPLDFSQGYDGEVLLQSVEELSAAGAPPPLTALTPKVRASNRRAGLIVGVIAAVMFAAAILMVAVGGLEPPNEEFITIDTQVAETRDYLIRPTLEAFQPRTTEDALNFPATIDANPTQNRPFLRLTATALAEEAE